MPRTHHSTHHAEEHRLTALCTRKVPKQSCTRLQKLADLKEAARQAALARDEFVMPEGLSRKEQRTLLARHKRVRSGPPHCDFKKASLSWCSCAQMINCMVPLRAPPVWCGQDAAGCQQQTDPASACTALLFLLEDVQAASHSSQSLTLMQEKHKAAMKHKKAKIAERRRNYKMKKAAREAGLQLDSLPCSRQHVCPDYTMHACFMCGIPAGSTADTLGAVAVGVSRTCRRRG